MASIYYIEYERKNARNNASFRVRVVPSEEDDNVVVLGNSIQTPWSRALAKYIELRNER